MPTPLFKKSRFALAFSLTMLPGFASAGVIGFLGNFDVINDTGTEAHGFEIDLEGLHSSDITDTFGGANRGFPSGRGFDAATAVVRYGAPTVTEYNNGGVFGTKVTYYGLWTPGTGWDFGTPSGSFVTPGDNCWTGGGVGYGASTPCDHFGVGTSKTASKTSYSWLHDNGSGQLTNANGQVSLPAPVITPPSPAPAGQPVAVVAQVQAPAPENETEFGEAIWVKVFKTELNREVGLEELIGGNPIIDHAETEIEWQLLQVDIKKPGSGQLESGYVNGIGPNAEAVIFRYEFYKFGGTYDPESHEALLNGSDSNPGQGDVGNYIGAQNNAINLNVLGAPVPVPPAFLLMGTGLLGFFASRRSQLKTPR